MSVVKRAIADREEKFPPIGLGLAVCAHVIRQLEGCDDPIAPVAVLMEQKEQKMKPVLVSQATRKRPKRRTAELVGSMSPLSRRP